MDWRKSLCKIFSSVVAIVSRGDFEIHSHILFSGLSIVNYETIHLWHSIEHHPEQPPHISPNRLPPLHNLSMVHHARYLLSLFPHLKYLRSIASSTEHHSEECLGVQAWYIPSRIVFRQAELNLMLYSIKSSILVSANVSSRNILINNLVFPLLDQSTYSTTNQPDESQHLHPR